MPLRARTELETHAVENQPPRRGDLLWADDRPLRDDLRRRLPLG